MKATATTIARFNPGVVRNAPVVGTAKVNVGSRNVAYAFARQRLVQVKAKISTQAVSVGAEPMRSSNTIFTDCQFKSFHQAKFTWR